MNDTDSRPTSTPKQNKWAPWWIYLVLMLGINGVRQLVLPYGVLPEIVNALIAVAIAGIVFLLITVIYRAVARRLRQPAQD